METIYILFVSVTDDGGWFVADGLEDISYRLSKENNLLFFSKMKSAEMKKIGTVKDLVSTLAWGELGTPRKYWNIIVQTDSGDQTYIVADDLDKYDEIDVYMGQQLEFLKSNRAPPPARDKRKAEGAAPAGKRSRGAQVIQFVQNTE